MCADEASEVDDHRLDVGRLPGRRPLHVRVPLCLQHGVEQVDVLDRKDLGRRVLGALLRKDGQVSDMSVGDGVEGDALAQVVGMVQPAVFDPCSCLQYRATIKMRFSDKQDATLDGAGLRLREDVA